MRKKDCKNQLFMLLIAIYFLLVVPPQNYALIYRYPTAVRTVCTMIELS